MFGLKRLKRWWQIRTGHYETPFDGEVPFWVFSTCVQLLLLGLLAKLLLPNNDFRKDSVVVSEQNEVLDIADLPEPEIEFNDLDIEECSTDDSVEFEIISETESPLMEIATAQPLTSEIIMDDIADLMTEIPSLNSEQILEAAHTTGSVGNVVTGASGAVDRLTQEILESLEENATMVVWLFDQSASLTRQRAQIRGRIDRIYRELNLLEQANAPQFESDEDKPLLTHVYAFGESVGPVLRQPTDNVDRIKSAIADIERDTSGTENVFSAIMRCVKDFRDYTKVDRKTGLPKRNVKFIVLCDEAGDDGDRCNDAIKRCDKAGIPVYVIGVPAPFGRAESRVKWVDPDPQFDQRPQVALVSQGPESLMPERLNLSFMGGNFGDLEMIDSGFGPFNLTRLCYQTGGIYFAVHPNRRRGRVSFKETAELSADLRYFFDPDVMRRYRPEYVSLTEYRKRANSNQARKSLLQAAAVPPTDQLVEQKVRFLRTNEAQFVRLVSNAQRSAAILQPKLDRLYNILKQGELDREKEASPRWQAGFDLAMGRVLSALLRAKSYNEMLALAKTKMEFKDPKNNTWLLRRSDDLSTTGSQNEKLSQKAREYLTRLVDDHPDTPWALLAKRELSTPLGWSWRESFTEPPKPRTPRQGGGGRARNPQPRQNQTPKPRRDIPRL